MVPLAAGPDVALEGVRGQAPLPDQIGLRVGGGGAVELHEVAAALSVAGELIEAVRAPGHGHRGGAVGEGDDLAVDGLLAGVIGHPGRHGVHGGAVKGVAGPRPGVAGGLEARRNVIAVVPLDLVDPVIVARRAGVEGEGPAAQVGVPLVEGEIGAHVGHRGIVRHRGDAGDGGVCVAGAVEHGEPHRPRADAVHLHRGVGAHGGVQPVVQGEGAAVDVDALGQQGVGALEGLEDLTPLRLARLAYPVDGALHILQLDLDLPGRVAIVAAEVGPLSAGLIDVPVARGEVEGVGVLVVVARGGGVLPAEHGVAGALHRGLEELPAHPGEGLLGERVAVPPA